MLQIETFYSFCGGVIAFHGGLTGLRVLPEDVFLSWFLISGRLRTLGLSSSPFVRATARGYGSLLLELGDPFDEGLLQVVYFCKTDLIVFQLFMETVELLIVHKGAIVDDNR